MKKNLIYNQLQNLINEKNVRFHMPGHKGRGRFGWEAFDFTEIPGSDNLHCPEGVIQKAQKKMAAIYGSEEACILVGGTTAGIQSAILGVCKEGDKLLIPTNCHRSVYAGLALGRIEGVFFEPICDTEGGFAKETTPTQVLDQLLAHPDVQGMVLVTPTYYGTASNTREIAAILHAQNKILIVDEAHGAHLHFHDNLPEDAVMAGADIVVQSTHKILGAFTQSSLLHMQGSRINRERIKRFLTMLQSSSPSYPLMMSVEHAVDEAEEKGKIVFNKIIRQWNDAFESWPRDEMPLKLYGSLDGKKYDKSKWLFLVEGRQGLEADRLLREKYHIQSELATQEHILAMTGIGTLPEDLEKLQIAVKAINCELAARKCTRIKRPAFVYRQEIPMYQVLFNESTVWRPITQCKDCLAGDFIIPYPPGIPALLPGSRISKEVLQYLWTLLEAGECVMGMREGMLPVIEE